MQLSRFFLKTIWWITIGFIKTGECLSFSNTTDTTFRHIYLERSSHSVSFQVEIAQTPKAIKHGLMGRQVLSKDSGMLFIFPTAQYVEFWMKNTYLALDIIFIDQNRQVVQLHSYAKPLDLTKIKSLSPVKYVLEIAAGSIKSYNIREGDLVSWESRE